MRTITLVTSNPEKAKEIAGILSEYDVSLEHQSEEYVEAQGATMEEISRTAAKELAEKLQRPVMVDDTGIFFEAYNSFPGALAKYIFKSIGYDGIFRLLADKDRKAYFETVVGYCEPGKDAMTFSGIMRGVITRDVQGGDDPHMPYDRIFIAEGETKVNTLLTIKEKNGLSQRAMAVRKLGEYL